MHLQTGLPLLCAIASGVSRRALVVVLHSGLPSAFGLMIRVLEDVERQADGVLLAHCVRRVGRPTRQPRKLKSRTAPLMGQRLQRSCTN